MLGNTGYVFPASSKLLLFVSLAGEPSSRATPEESLAASRYSSPEDVV